MGMLSFKKAKKFSMQKWEWLAENPPLQEESGAGYMSRFKRANPELKELLSNCGFCERYIKTPSPCSRCEFGAGAGKCKVENSLYSLWSDAIYCEQIKKGTELAKKIFKTIQNLEEK